MRTFSLICLEKDKYDGKTICVDPSAGLGGVTSTGTVVLVPTGAQLSERKQIFKNDNDFKLTTFKFSFDGKFILLGTFSGEVLKVGFDEGQPTSVKLSETEERAAGEPISSLAISKHDDMIAAATKR